MRLPGLDRAIKSEAKLQTKAAPDPGLTLLVITRDAEVYTSIREVAAAWNWTVRHQGEVSLDTGGAPPAIVVLDADLAGDRWKEALVTLRAGGHNPCILLVSRVFDSYLWEEVVRHGGFDVITRSAGREQLVRILRFAGFWKTRNPQAPALTLAARQP